MWLGKVESTLYGKEVTGLGVQLIPLGMPALGIGGLATMPIHLYIEERGAPKRKHESLGSSLSLVIPFLLRPRSSSAWPSRAGPSPPSHRAAGEPIY